MPCSDLGQNCGEKKMRRHCSWSFPFYRFASPGEILKAFHGTLKIPPISSTYLSCAITERQNSHRQRHDKHNLCLCCFSLLDTGEQTTYFCCPFLLSFTAVIYCKLQKLNERGKKNMESQGLSKKVVHAFIFNR